MKKLNYLFLMFLSVSLFSCEEDEGGALDTTDPTVNITAPPNGEDYILAENGITINVSFNAEDDLGLETVALSIVRPGGTTNEIRSWDVNDFLNDDTEFSQEYELELPGNTPVGDYTIMVVARDEQGNEGMDSITITLMEPAANENAINISGVEEGASYENIGTETPVTYEFTDPEGADSVNVQLLNQDGVELMNQGYNQTYFTDNEIDNTTAFNVEDNLYVPNVGASRGENTLTVTSYRNNDGTWTETGTQSRTFTSAPQADAREINVTTTAPESFDENSRMFLAGNFRGGDRYGRDYDPAYELSRNEDGTYGTTLYANTDQNFNYRYSTMDAEGNASVEVDSNCAEVADYPRAYTYADGLTTIEEEVNYTGYGTCVD